MLLNHLTIYFITNISKVIKFYMTNWNKMVYDTEKWSLFCGNLMSHQKVILNFFTPLSTILRAL